LALETGLDAATTQRLRTAELRALAAVSRVIVTSRTTAAALADYGVAASQVRVVSPGTDPAPLACGSSTPPLQLLCVATLTPRKGHAVLIEALAGLRDRAWRLACVGSAERHPATATALQRQIARAGIEDRVELLGELDEDGLGQLYARADAFVLASHYEGYGMAFAEALARGLPIVATCGGATAETVPQTAGLLVRPGDGEALRTALRRLIDDEALRARLRAGARGARRALPTWQEAGDRFAAAILNGVAG
jgi:glycosyltransferase involved in cell wall biosynthesis